jgi:rhamnogalacturonyl hydrolase YesR
MEEIVSNLRLDRRVAVIPGACRQWLVIAAMVWLVLMTADKGMKFSAMIYNLLGTRPANHATGTTTTPQRSTITPQTPGKNEILAILRKVNSYQLSHPVLDAAEAADPLFHPWPRVTWYTGVMAAWEATKDQPFFEQSLAYGRELHWQVSKERVGPNRLFLIQLLAELYFVMKDRAMIEPSIKWLATPDPLTPAGSKQWYMDARDTHEPPIPYADSLYGAPALAMLAKATGDKYYLNIMNAFFDDVTKRLFDEESGLYYRDPSYIGRRTSNGKKILWSRGNGWVFAGIPRVLDYLPEREPNRQRYLNIFRRMAAALIKRQGADGLWRVNLDDSDQFPNPETSGSGFFCFGLAWGINHGVLSRQEYLPAAEKAWAGLTRNLSPEGKVLWGQLVDSEPNSVARESTHEFVTGAFMLAGSEVYKLAH